MTKDEIQQKIAELKSDYVRIQGDLEKLESVGRNVSTAEKQLEEMEKELKMLRELLASTS
ncbi:SE1832 family protein [Bacillus kwashiorkori]|uniref:SE1832 family protein n=1 Tax=Bacillus kwashiorkori TaxID=1522318 RepID=UPI0007852B59|nr:SE1832 family protein [Bacillus kwashiorkori]